MGNNGSAHRIGSAHDQILGATAAGSQQLRADAARLTPQQMTPPRTPHMHPAGAGGGGRTQQQQEPWTPSAHAAGPSPVRGSAPPSPALAGTDARLAATGAAAAAAVVAAASADGSGSHAANIPGYQPPVVPTVFRWEHGGESVHITGTFNGWSYRIPMCRSGNDFIYIAGLPSGLHAYKFVVDGEWRYAPEQPTLSDGAGNINNCIDLTEFLQQQRAETESAVATMARRDSPINLLYGQTLPNEEDYGKEPPLLPPHLRTIVLNHSGPEPTDGCSLAAPAAVTLHHLYCTAIKDGVMVQAVTHRYRRKFVTSVFYAPMAGNPSLLHDPAIAVATPTVLDVLARVAAAAAAAGASPASAASAAVSTQAGATPAAAGSPSLAVAAPAGG